MCVCQKANWMYLDKQHVIRLSIVPLLFRISCLKIYKII